MNIFMMPKKGYLKTLRKDTIIYPNWDMFPGRQNVGGDILHATLMKEL